MIIVCPHCSKPYDLPAQQISALVQVACPSCNHAVILDFEAANDPSLREPGHRFASGFLSKQDYLQSLAQPEQIPAANRAPVAQEPPAKDLQEPPAHPAPPQLPPKTRARTPVPAPKRRPASIRPARVSPSQVAPAQPLGAPAQPKSAPIQPLSASGSAIASKTPPPPRTHPDRMSSPLAARVRSSSHPGGSRKDSQAFPDLGPGFGGEAPKPPPMAEQNPARGPRPSTMHFDLNASPVEQDAPPPSMNQDSGLLAPAQALPDDSGFPVAPAGHASDLASNSASGLASGLASRSTSGLASLAEDARIPPPADEQEEPPPTLVTPPRQPQTAPETSLTNLNENELAVASSGGAWIWWVVIAILVVGGALFGFSMMQSGHQPGSDLLHQDAPGD